MSLETDTRDRVIRLEAEVESLTAKVDEMRKLLNEVHGFLQQARGAKWFLIAAAGLGGFISAKIAPFLPWLGAK